MKKFTNADLRNLLHYTMEEVIKTKFNPQSVLVGIKLGYIAGKIETQQYTSDQLLKINSFLSDILSEFIFKEVEPEFDIDDLLQSLHQELENKVDEIDGAVGDYSEGNDVTDEDIDKVLLDIEQDYQRQVESIRQDEEHIKANAERYKKVYHEICEYITSKFDSVLLEIDRLEENTWLQDESTPLRVGELRRIIIDGSENKLREVMNGDEREMRLFHQWVKTYDGPDPDSPGNEWWANV